MAFFKELRFSPIEITFFALNMRGEMLKFSTVSETPALR